MSSGDDQSVFDELRTVFVVHLESVAMAFADFVTAVKLLRERSVRKLTRVGSQSHGTAFFLDADLVFHDRDDLVGRLVVEFLARSVGDSCNIARVLDHGDLQLTVPEKWNLFFSSDFNGFDFTFDPTFTEPARNQKSLSRAQSLQRFWLAFAQCFAVDVIEFNLGIVRKPAVNQ